MEKYQFSEYERSLIEKARFPLAVYQFLNKRVVTLLLSDGFCELFGYTERAQAYYDMDHDMYKDVHPDDAARISEAAYRFATEGGKYEVVYRTRIIGSPEYRIVHAQGEHCFTPEGIRLALVWYTDEGTYSPTVEARPTELTRALNNALREESAIRASKYDYLTGLPSMTWFFELGADKVSSILERGGNPALVFLDFHGMKYFNRKNGFAEGDRLLQGFARILASHFGNDECSRLGQDHFAVITEEEGLEQALLEIFEASRGLNGGLTLPVHAGIHLHRLETVGISAACDRAKIACDALRSRYSSCFNYYNLSMRDDEEKRQYVIANLDRALVERWIHVYYQPIVRAVSGRVCHEEALARWIDPVKGWLSPADFIPALEDSGLLYKLDLYVVDRVLEKLKSQVKAGLHRDPQSVNLSRSDFDACDMVEEIRRRVDDAGVERNMLTIEITESVVGSDFEFMKAQIQRFQSLGFAVWMDDFGSGYSALDVLQSIRFDLIKFDMKFLHQLDESNNGRIILTELVHMATALGVDTVCEGVETEEQVVFLREIGCSKLQGFYYTKAIPLEEIVERNRKGIQIGFENPAESDYYEAIGRVNLNDLTLIANEDNDAYHSSTNTVPIGILEYLDGKVRFVRSNRSFREFMKRLTGQALPERMTDYVADAFGPNRRLMEQVGSCCRLENRLFFEETLPDGFTAHASLRWIGRNPVTGCAAAALVILSVNPPDLGTTYANIARALAADYFNIFYVNLNTEQFIEYSSSVGKDNLAVERHGESFFAAARQDAMHLLYEEDRLPFVEAFTKEKVLEAMSKQGSFTLTYRLLSGDGPIYASMKVMRLDAAGSYIIVGVSSIDAQMKQKAVMDKVRTNEITYARLMALTGNYIALYTVDPDTGAYVEYNSTVEYEDIGLSKTGKNFFVDAIVNGKRLVHEEDYPEYAARMTRENILQHVRERGVFALKYRLVLHGTVMKVRLRAGLVREADGEKLIVGILH